MHSPLASPRVAGRFEKAMWYVRFSRWCRIHACPVSNWRPAIYEDLVREESLTEPLDYLEFGVYQGRSMKWWLSLNTHPDSRFYGFDTFVGLPEKWDWRERGHFSTEGETPQVDDARCRFIKGLFQDTLPEFLKAAALNRKKIVHIDADLFSATLYVLLQMAPHFRKGDILMFDEFQIWMDEFRAFMLFLEAFPVKYTVLRRSPDWARTVLRIESDRAEF